MSFCQNCGKELIGTPEFCMNCGARPNTATAFCPNCGVPTAAAAVICVKCGVSLVGRNQTAAAAPGVVGGVSKKSRLVYVLLCLFLGELGIHRFYVGKIGTAVGMLVLTIVGYATVIFIFGFIPLAAVWIWNLVDFIIGVIGNAKDKEGKKITNWGT